MKLEINKKITVEAIPVQGDIYACKITESIKDVELSSYETLAFKKDIENFNGVELPKPTIKSSMNNGPYSLNLYKKSVNDLLLKPSHAISQVLDGNVIFDKVLMNKPYSYGIENGFSEVQVLGCYFYNKTFCNLNGDMVPQAIDFSYQDRIDSNKYDLDKMISVLSKREDVFSIDGGTELKKVCLPYDNYGKETLNFVWVPNAEQMKKHQNILSSRNSKYKAIEEVFGIKPL